MLKQAWRSYLASLHPRNIKKIRESYGYTYFWLVLFVFYAYIAVEQTNGYADLYCGVLLRLLLPLGLMGYSNLTSRYLMPKAMFICPMKEDERKEYINCVIFIKISAMVVSSLCTELIWSKFFGFRLWEVMIVPFLIFLVGVAEYLGYEVKRDEKGQLPSVTEDKRGDRIPVWKNSAVAMLVIVSIAFLVGYDMEMLVEENAVSQMIFLGLAGVCSAFVILLAYQVVKGQHKYVIEQSSDYELHFKILGKVEGPKTYNLFGNKR